MSLDKEIQGKNTSRTTTPVTAVPVADPATNSTNPATLWSKLVGCFWWYSPAILAVGGSITLIYLNFTEYAIGGEIGKDATETANVLGALQLAIKIHEITLVTSLVLITQQWILRSLQSGILFGLVGVELLVPAPTFLISSEYWAASGYALSNKRPGQVKRRDVGIAIIFLTIAWGVAMLSGVASGVLMIPRVGWFFEKQLSSPEILTYGYPNILVDQRLGIGRYRWERNPFTYVEITGGLQYWTNFARARWEDQWYDDKRFEGILYPENIAHSFMDSMGKGYINTSTTWGRYLNGNWDTGTEARRVMVWDIKEYEAGIHKTYTESKTYWSGHKFEVAATGMVAKAQCRYMPRVPCAAGASSSDWCYMSGNSLQSSRNFLALDQRYNTTYSDSRIFTKKAYLTEGPRMKSNPRYTDSIELVLEGGFMSKVENFTSDPSAPVNILIPTENVTVCSISTTISSVAVSSLETIFNAEYADYRDRINQTLLYHELWLDNAYAYHVPLYSLVNEAVQNTISNATGNITFPPRNISKFTTNSNLREFADAALTPQMSDLDWKYDAVPGEVQAAELEMVVAGAFVHVLAFIIPTNTQYSVNETIVLPPELMPAPQIFYGSAQRIVDVYKLGYGYRLSTRTGMLGLFVLLLHSVIVVFGTLWQLLWERTIIDAPSTVPGYLASDATRPPAALTLDTSVQRGPGDMGIIIMEGPPGV